MRNAFGTKQVSDFGFGAEFDPDFAERSVSQDQIAIIWAPDGGVVVASPAERSGTRIDVARFPAETDVAASVSLRRTREFGLPPLTRSTHFLTAVADHSERTQILALDGERLSYDDAVLLEWLVNAERQMLTGTDNHPVFETSLEDTACAIARLPNGLVSMTEVPRTHINALGARLRAFAGVSSGSPLSVTIETPLRCIARYFLESTKEGSDTLHHGRRNEVTAFLSMGMSGYSFGLWSPAAGLFGENAFLAPADVNKTPSKRRDPNETIPDNGNQHQRNINEYVRKAFDQLMLQMSSERMSNLQLSGFTQVVYAAEQSLAEQIKAVANEISSREGVEFVSIKAPVEEAVAAGLILGSYSFGTGRVKGADSVEPVDLTRDILVLADTEETERRRAEEGRMLARRDKAVLAVLAPPVVMAGILLALVASLIAGYFFTAIRDSRADATAQELRPALERRKAYEANLKWYQDFISEVSKLRRQQPVGIGLLRQLNENYPFASDPSFFVSDLKLTPTGDIEVKGLSRNKDAVATFLKSLEFAGGEKSGTRLFSNLAYEIQEVAAPTVQATQANLPKISGSTLTSSGAAPGIVQWRMTGSFVPVAEFQPKPAASPKPGAPQPPAPQPAAPAKTS
jgi:hypothetical protein